MLLAGWSLFAFAGVYAWTLVPLVAGTVVFAVVSKPSIGGPATRWLDLALAACLAVIAFQMVPVPATLRAALSPAAAQFDRALWFDRQAAPDQWPARPLSLDPAATGSDLVVGLALVALFWSARTVFDSGGIRRTVRGLGVMGLVVSAIAIVQHAMAPRLLYGLWPPAYATARPFGPFGNRNDLATWLVMGIPLIIGYGMTRIESSRRLGHGSSLASLDSTATWLGAEALLMVAALITSLSRSGLTAIVVALSGFVWLTFSRVSRGTGARLIGVLALVVAVATMYVNMGALTARVDETLAAGIGGRAEIWRATWAMIQDFRWAGVGVGAYVRGMIFYQPVPHVFYFNHAHNQYLQFAAEGGWLLVVPAAAAATTGVVAIVRRLRADRTPMFWMRAGAATGMLAVAVQSLWDTGLIVPANAVLFAITAAIALHAPHPA